jgi:ribosomal protein S18 acetylase RimI-like enzyme
VCDAEPRAIEPDVPLAIERFEREQDLPGSLRAELRAYAGAEYEEVLRAEFARRGTLWIGLVQGRVAAFQWSRRASSIPVWFVPLRPADVVLLGTETLPELRGRGIAPAMLAHIVRRERSGEGRVLVDCKVWNRPAMRAFERAGFRRLAECAPPGWERAA